MEDYALGVLGIVVSVLLFLIGYRQTVGAKKERVIAGNAEVEKILVRRVVLEEYKPTLPDISRLLEGKARDFRVKVGDLYSEAQVLNSIFTRMLETDFIAQAQRQEILTKLLPILEESESEPYDEQKVLQLTERQDRRLTAAIATPATMAIIAATVGAIVTVLPRLGDVDVELKGLFVPVVATMLASLGFIAASFAALRVRESQQEVSISSSSASLETAIKFEREVAKAISASELTAVPAGPTDRGYDFLVEADDYRVLVESKSWTRPMPSSLIARVAERVERMVQEQHASEGIVVTQSSIKSPTIEGHYKNVRFMTIKQLKQHLSQKASQRPNRP